MKRPRKAKATTFNLYVFVVLAAFEILMSFTFLGYVHIPPISATFAYLPVMLAAEMLGTVQSTAMGAIFGLASMYKSSESYILPTDKAFSPLYSGKPLASLLLAIGARTLFGFLTGIMFSCVKKKKHSSVWVGVAALAAPLIHAVIVYSVMIMFFREFDYGALERSATSGINIAVTLLGVIVTLLFKKLYDSELIEKVKASVSHSVHNPYADSGKRTVIVSVFAAFVLGMTILAALYFSNRTSIMLEMHGIEVSTGVDRDLTHLQVQFTAAMISLNVICVIVLILLYQYTAYKNFLGELDPVTGVMGRRLFLNCCERSQKLADLRTVKNGWFLFADVDLFKDINDTYGHSVGDDVLREVALALKRTFYDCGIVGRMGGDEFSVLIDKKEVPKDELETRLGTFYGEIAGLLPSQQGISCSIGVCGFSYPAEISELMNKADENLYKAKNNGRGCYVVG